PVTFHFQFTAVVCIFHNRSFLMIHYTHQFTCQPPLSGSRPSDCAILYTMACPAGYRPPGRAVRCSPRPPASGLSLPSLTRLCQALKSHLPMCNLLCLWPGRPKPLRRCILGTTEN